MDRTEKGLAFMFGLAIFVYVVLRAIFVPTFHDEAATFFHYIVPGNFVPFKAHWDANNHFLNSALAYIGYKYLGPELIWIRLPNVLSFIIYALYSFLMANALKGRMMRWFLFVALLTAAFPLEFFAQARGYGMSLAFMMGAVFHGAKFLKEQSPKHQLATWFWLTLAVAANLAMINTYLIFAGFFTLAILLKPVTKRFVNLGVLVAFGFSVLGSAAFYGFELRERGLLYTGFDHGFLQVTVASLIKYQLGSDVNTLRWAIAFLGVVSGVYILWKWLLERYEWNATRLVAALLLLNAVGSILLNKLFGMNFPENRVGLYYVPLFIITVAAAIDQLAIDKPKMKWLGLSLLFLPIHLSTTVGLDTTLLWSKWHVSKALYQKAVEIQYKHPEPLMISGDYLNELGWSVYNFQNEAELQPMQRRPVPDTLADLIIARPYDFDMGAIGYDTVFHDMANEVYLLQRNRPILWTQDTSVHLLTTSFSGSDEFYELLNGPSTILPSKHGYFNLKASIKSEGRFSDAHLVITSYNAEGDALTYDYIPLHWLRPQWNGQMLQLRRTFNLPEDATSIKMYLWNIHQHNLTVNVEEFQVFSPSEITTVGFVR